MTDKMYNEKAARGETDPERKGRSENDAPDVEGHRAAMFEPEKTRLSEDEDVKDEHHRQ